ncbi:uracil-5-carboxylate decarboxylase [Durotheca rogersii]|uniref:uracil-5-carboxylate decarboxylase n=1 Tax=Durotheca rogersii TaxID=419775 RepID=UPI00221EF0EA|nr:uracil-5-carboxylate decarboxylase [Durotheca rogersii]KAI5862293.1 uracil-5-carboxylate decarboxylase [Durotheca rogersii]
MASPEHHVVDIHTHMYPPAYIRLLESRSSIPMIRQYPGGGPPRLIILRDEVDAMNSVATADASSYSSSQQDPPGRPVTTHYSSLEQKLHFMDTHGIDVSVVSLANPWLDFVAPEEAGETAQAINQDFEDMCVTTTTGRGNAGSSHPRLYFFATLPLTAPPEALLAAVEHVRGLKHCRGVILGTSGLGGAGLDDPALLPVLESLAERRLPVFLHPHYGLPSSVWGGRGAAGAYGHVLPLALGFPVETTVAVARMYLAGVFDAVPALRLVLAHGGGALPFLAGRIESCVRHDGKLVGEAKSQTSSGSRRSIWQVLREQVYLDAVVYSEVALRAAIDAAGGADRLMFGTDHPFFPPVGAGEDAEQGVWESAAANAKAVAAALGEGSAEARAVMGGNAIRVLRLHEEGD